MRKAAILLCAVCAMVQAQLPGIIRNQLPPDLVQYFALTTDQQRTINRLNEEFTRFSLEKSFRAAQVHQELEEENRRPVLDAIALGMRYLELEAIRRQTVAERDKTIAAVQEALTPAQKAKLAALQDAMRLAFTGCEAVNHNFTAAPNFIVGVLSATPIPAGGTIARLPIPSPLCGATRMRSGDFSGTLVFSEDHPR